MQIQNQTCWAVGHDQALNLVLAERGKACSSRGFDAAVNESSTSTKAYPFFARSDNPSLVTGKRLQFIAGVEVGIGSSLGE